MEDAAEGKVRLADSPTTGATRFYLGPVGRTLPAPTNSPPAEIYSLAIGDNVALLPDVDGPPARPSARHGDANRLALHGRIARMALLAPEGERGKNC
ncbi:MAG: hypothetical protein IT424_05655 [Pirellulales bacterium]|nr:hypothetical protein [Pirellulales bacterium]